MCRDNFKNIRKEKPGLEVIKLLQYSLEKLPVTLKVVGCSGLTTLLDVVFQSISNYNHFIISHFFWTIISTILRL